MNAEIYVRMLSKKEEKRDWECAERIGEFFAPAETRWFRSSSPVKQGFSDGPLV